MNPDKYKQEVSFELKNIDRLATEVISLAKIIGDTNPDTVQISAMSTFIAQFYSGIENIMKRTTKFNNIPLPSTVEWHSELFKRFCNPPYETLPVLFDNDITSKLTIIRKARHYFIHGYSFNIDWEILKPTADSIEFVYARIKTKVLSYLESISEGN